MYEIYIYYKDIFYGRLFYQCVACSQHGLVSSLIIMGVLARLYALHYLGFIILSQLHVLMSVFTSSLNQLFSIVILFGSVR